MKNHCMKHRMILCLALTCVAANFGCPMAPLAPVSDEVLDNLDSLPDADNDGFADLSQPESVDVSETVAVAIVNEITRDDAEAIAVQFIEGGIPPALLDLVGVTLDFSVTRIYADGEEIVDSGSRDLAPFEIRVEAACPDSIVASMDVTAQVPFVGDVAVLPTQEFVLNQGAGGGFGYECATVISLTAAVDENGQPDIQLTIEPQ